MLVCQLFVAKLMNLKFKGTHVMKLWISQRYTEGLNSKTAAPIYRRQTFVINLIISITLLRNYCHCKTSKLVSYLVMKQVMCTNLRKWSRQKLFLIPTLFKNHLAGAFLVTGPIGSAKLTFCNQILCTERTAVVFKSEAGEVALKDFIRVFK